MSVRVTERLIGDVVIASGLPKSPLMVVQEIDEEKKMVRTIWFSDSNECQEGLFPASAIDRAEPRQAPKVSKPTKEKKDTKEKKAAPGRRGRRPAASK